jgi:hypothetical protein
MAMHPFCLMDVQAVVPATANTNIVQTSTLFIAS